MCSSDLLSKFSQEELRWWAENGASVREAIDLFLAGKPEMAMNKFNRKSEAKDGR